MPIKPIDTNALNIPQVKQIMRRITQEPSVTAESTVKVAEGVGDPLQKCPDMAAYLYIGQQQKKIHPAPLKTPKSSIPEVGAVTSSKASHNQREPFNPYKKKETSTGKLLDKKA